MTCLDLGVTAIAEGLGSPSGALLGGDGGQRRSQRRQGSVLEPTLLLAD